jgi:hypothetical protein
MRHFLALAVALMALATTGACLDDPLGSVEATCPNRDTFKSFVSPLVERRCGTLDCHGHDQRWFRVYGELGLRHPAELNRTGGDGTTALELEANYRTICSSEPDLISEVALDPGGQSVNQLLLVRKARGVEGHKGGQVFNPFDDADLCVVGWLRGDNPKSVRAACQKALDQLPDNVELPPVP